MNTLLLVQARMSSSRLPGKVLLDLGGQPMLARVIERARRAKGVDQVAVATTTDPADDPIVAFCQARGYPVYRGSMFDVLDRFYRAARHFGAAIVVRLTADCPIIDPAVIDDTLAAFHAHEVDFAANRLPPPWTRTWPIGLDTEVVSFAALERAWKEAAQPYEREHVMPYFYDVAGRFKIFVTNHDPDLGHLRWTVDTQEDLDLLREIFARFDGRDDFSWQEVLRLVEREPHLALINAGVRHKSGLDVDSRMEKKA